MVFLVVGLGIVVALIVIALVLAPVLIDETALTELARDQVRDKTGGELVIEGDTKLSLFPRLSVDLNDATLTIPPKDDYASGVEAKLNQLSLGLSVIPTLMGSTEFSELSIDGIHARITAPQALPALPEPTPELSDREWELIGRRLRSEREAQRIRLESGAADSLLVVVAADVLTVTDVTLEMLDADGELDNRLTLEQLVFRDINTTQAPIRVEAAAEVQAGEGAEPVRLELNGVVRVPTNLSLIRLDRIEALMAGALAEPIRATLTGDLTLYPLRFTADLEAALPGGDVTGDLVYAELESPVIDINLTSDKLDLDRLQAPAGAGNATQVGTANAERAPAPTAAPPVPLPVGPLKMLDLALAMQAQELITAGQRITDATLNLRVRDGVANLETLTGVLHEGQLDTTAVFNARHSLAELQVEGGLNGVNLDSLLTSLGNPDLISGGADMNWNITSRGATAEALKLGLDGDLDVMGSDVVVESVSFQALMCEAISRIRNTPLTEEMPATTAVSDMALAIDFAAGRADVDTLSLATQGLTMSGDGGLALDTLGFSLVIDTLIDNTLMELDPACEVNERYAAVAWPIVCEGNLGGAPGQWCGIDTGRIAEQLLKDEARDQLEEKAGKLLNKLFGG